MVCSLTIFLKFITQQHKKYLEENFQFGGFFDIENGNEIPIPTRKSKENNYERMIWRKAIYKNMELLLGWKHDQLTKQEYWHLKITGSIHKYACDGDNSGLFTASEATTALNNLCSEMKIDKSKAKITGIELGVNILEAGFSVNEYCRLDLLRYKTIPFNWMASKGKKGNIGKEAILTHRRVKAYAKGDEIFRFEVHYDDMQDLRDLYNLFYLSDLSEKLIIKMAEDILPVAWNEVVTLDGIRLEDNYLPKGLSKKNIDILYKYSNSTRLLHIDDLILEAKKNDNKKEVARLYKENKRYRSRFDSLINIYGNQKHTFIFQKIIEVINYSKEKCPLSEIGVKSNNWTKSEISNADRSDSELINYNKSEDCITKINKMNNKLIEVSKNKRQSVKDKKEGKERVYQSFMKALNLTIRKLEKAQLNN